MELRENIADIQHEIWSHWMKYQFSQCQPDTTGLYRGCLIIPAEKVERWTKQMNTPYSELTEQEKESDRHQADKVLQVVTSIDRPALERLLQLVVALPDDIGDLHSTTDEVYGLIEEKTGAMYGIVKDLLSRFDLNEPTP